MAGPLHIQGQALHLITSTDHVSGSGHWPAAVHPSTFKPLCASAIELLENELVTLMGMTVGLRMSTSTVATSPQIQQMLPASEAGATGCSLPFTFTCKHCNAETVLLDKQKKGCKATACSAACHYKEQRQMVLHGEAQGGTGLKGL